MEKLVWETVKRKPKDLIVYEKNPRKITPQELSRLKASLNDFGLVEIPVIDFDEKIIAGHQRVKLLMLMEKGDEEIDVRRPNRKLTEDEFKEYNVRSNRSSGEFSIEKLLEEFSKDELIELGFKSIELKESKELELYDDFEVEGMPIKDFEGYDYLVFVFDNNIDLMNAHQIFNIEKFDYSFIEGKKKIGLGRVLWGRELMKKLNEKNG